jgi:hypothetical protein
VLVIGIQARVRSEPVKSEGKQSAPSRGNVAAIPCRRPEENPRRVARRILIGALLLMAIAEFVGRGPVRFLRDPGWNDLLSPYIQAKAWAQGKNPYSVRDLVDSWPPEVERPLFVDQDGANGELPTKRGIPTPYPLTTFVLLAPLTQLNWSTAEMVWISMNVAAAILSLLGLMFVSGVSWRDPRGQLFLAMGFALAPIHTGLATGNPAILATGLTVGAFWAAESGWLVSSGILLGLAVCLKPPLAACLLLYYLVRGRRKVVGIALLLSSVIASIGLVRLKLAGVDWFPTYFENARLIFAPGSLADFTGNAPVRFNMINLHVLAYAVSGSAALARILSLVCGASLAAAWLWIVLHSESHTEQLELSALLVISLLPVYHRFYDAALLIWPLAWSLLVTTRRKMQRLTILLILPFFVPWASVLDQLVPRGIMPATAAETWWWKTIAMPYEVWSLLLLGVMLLYFMHFFEGVPPSPLRLQNLENKRLR